MVNRSLTTQAAPRAWAAVAVLAPVGTLDDVDRFLPGVLVEPIRQDLALSDTAIGVIIEFGFLIMPVCRASPSRVSPTVAPSRPRNPVNGRGGTARSSATPIAAVA